MRPAERRRHAINQRQHAKRLREQGTPRREDLARAFLEAARRDLVSHRIVNIGLAKAESGLWRRLFVGTVAVLVEKGFNEEASTGRLERVLLPPRFDPALPIADLDAELPVGE